MNDGSKLSFLRLIKQPKRSWVWLHPDLDGHPDGWEKNIMQTKRLLKELTPDAFACGGGVGCPSVFETDEGTLIVIGKAVSSELRERLPEGRVGADETVIEIPRGLVAGLKI